MNSIHFWSEDKIIAVISPIIVCYSFISKPYQHFMKSFKATTDIIFPLYQTHVILKLSVLPSLRLPSQSMHIRIRSSIFDIRWFDRSNICWLKKVQYPMRFDDSMFDIRYSVFEYRTLSKPWNILPIDPSNIEYRTSSKI